jgi:hypothetical protein
MAGLLDFLTTDEAQLGLGLLAAGGPSPVPMSFGQRIAAGVGQAQAAKDGRLRNKLLESQIAENTSQDAMRRAQLARQQQQDAYYLGGAAPGAAATGAAGASPASAGSALKAAAGAPPDAPPPAQGKFAEWSQQFGIPVDALVADYFSNGGKGIADMLFKRGTPDMQVQNGYVYDKNRVQPGFLPSLNTSQDGKSTVTLIGQDGMPNVMPTPGALGAFGSFEEARNRSAANYQPERVLSPDGQMVVRPRSDVLQPSAPLLPGRPMGAAPGYGSEAQMRVQAGGGGFQNEAAAKNISAAAQREIAAIERDLATPGKVPDAASRQALQAQVADLRRQAAAVAPVPLIGPGAGVRAAPLSAGNVVELSPQQQAINDAQKAAATSMANQTGGIMKESAEQATSAVQAVGTAQRIQQAIDSNKTLTGPGASLRLRGLQIAETLGIPGRDDAERIANTRVAIQEMAKLTIAGRKTMSGQGAITDKESALAERASSGDIDGLTAAEIKILAAAAERSARFQYAQHQGKLDEMNANPATSSQVGIFKVAPLPEARGGASQAKQVTRTGTLNGRRVVQYSDGSTAYAD